MASFFQEMHDAERKLQEAWRDYGKNRKPKTYSATHPAYSGTALQAKHGGEHVLGNAQSIRRDEARSQAWREAAG